MRNELNGKTESKHKEEKAENILKRLNDNKNLMQEFFKNPYVRFALISASIYGVLYVSRYFVNASAETIRAFKNLKRAVKE